MMQRLKRCFSVMLLAIACGVTAAGAEPTSKPAAPADPAKVQFFEQKVRPILETSCLKCHGGEAKIKGGLRLTSRQSILTGGDSGPGVSLENPSDSLLLKAINYVSDDLQMPPKEKLPAEKIAVLTQWVQMGIPMTPGSEATATVAAGTPKKMAPPVNAETMKFWSFQPVKRPSAPKVAHDGWVKSPIDAFILSKLESQGLEPTPPASKTVLLRRAYYDLTGLPPTPAQVDAFLAETSPKAFEKVVDTLLSSPRYGERWGRHWLDLVRFSETNSFERDGIKPNAWRFRDYVIAAFNSDKPYDQFIREQIAGDELDHVTPDSIVATGYYRLGLWDDEPADREQARYDNLDDLVMTTGQVFLGLTTNCARCHDHKLDPIPQKDYYRLLSFFQGIRPYSNGAQDVLTDITPLDADQARRDDLMAINRRLEELRRQVAAIEEPVVASISKGTDAKAIPRDPKQRQEMLDPILLKALGNDEFRRYGLLRTEAVELEKRRSANAIQALSVKEFGPKPAPTFVMVRGNAHAPGEEVEPAFLSVLNPPKAVIPTPRPNAATSGRRRVLAEWLASTRNPLVARVMVNRIWQGHFGRGIVRSPNDFGSVGDRPTHPELLDWLADEFVARGWKLKTIQKMIMMSSAYQMASTANPVALAKDPQNDLFWRFDMRRLEAEEVRDSILAVNGTLNLKMGGPGIFPTISAAVLAGQSKPGDGWGQSSPEERARRSVYIHQKRSLTVPILATFDTADNDATCPARFTTTQSTQALAMLNSDFINAEARAFADRLRKETASKPEDQVRLALRLTLNRDPAQNEIDRGVRFMDGLQKDFKVPADVALNQFCLLVLNLNEFVYLD